MEKSIVEFLTALIFISNVASAGYCSHVAVAKNLNGINWGIGGLFFGLIALIEVAGMPEKKRY